MDELSKTLRMQSKYMQTIYSGDYDGGREHMGGQGDLVGSRPGSGWLVGLRLEMCRGCAVCVRESGMESGI